MRRQQEARPEPENATRHERRPGAGRLVAALAVLIVLAGSVALAVTRPERSVTTRSEEAYIHYEKGMDALQSHFLPQAAQEWRAAVAIDSTFAMAWMRIARLAHHYGDPAEAGHALHMAQAQLGRVPEKERLHIRLVAADMTGNEAERQAIQTELLARYPEDVEMLTMAGNRAYHRGDFREALSCFEKVVARDPGVGQAYNMMGYTLAELGRWSEAVEALQKYTFLTPGQPNPHDSLGEIYLRTGRYDAALAEFDRAKALKPDFGWAYYHRAATLSCLGRNMDALEEIAGARHHAPDLPDSEHWDRFEIVLLQRAGRSAPALERIAAFDERFPDGYFAPFMAGFIHARNGDTEAARASLRTFQARVAKAKDGEIKPSFMVMEEAMYHELAGHISMAEKDWNGGVDSFTKCLDLTDHWGMQRSVRVELMRCLVETGRPDAALETGRGILAVNPGDPDANFWCGRAFESLGRSAEADGHYRRAAETLAGADPDHPLLREVRERSARS